MNKKCVFKIIVQAKMIIFLAKSILAYQQIITAKVEN